MVVTRFKATISYDGSEFYGYQIQPGKRTIQDEIQKVLSHLNNQPIKVVASGRTDLKVHALSQVIHFDSYVNIKADKYLNALNRLLPGDIHVNNVAEVDAEFHARFSAKGKHYRYYLNTGMYDVFQARYQYQYNHQLDVNKMNEAGRLFIGEHDFRHFTTASSEEVESYVRRIEKVSVFQQDDLVIFDFVGNGFMRYMIRMMVGMLIKIGEDRKDKKEISVRLNNVEHAEGCSFKAPPEGLYLVEVYY